MCATCGRPASRFSGPQQRQPMHARGRNKGIRAYTRLLKRSQALDRNADTAPEKRSTKRKAGSSPLYRPDQLLATRPDGPDPTGPLVSWEPLPPEKRSTKRQTIRREEAARG